MRLLLDTHVALWTIVDSPALSVKARALIGDSSNTVVVSAVTIWEIAIKHPLGRGGPNDMPVSGVDALAWFKSGDFELLGISPAHAAAVEMLPPHHADPFDRLLVAQAMTEPLKLLTHDRRLAAYGDHVLLV